MSFAKDIHAHFDGKVIVPDEPVNLPVNQPLVINVGIESQWDADDDVKPSIELTPEQRRIALRKLVKMMAGNPILPLEATRRINMYDDERY